MNTFVARLGKGASVSTRAGAGALTSMDALSTNSRVVGLDTHSLVPTFEFDQVITGQSISTVNYSGTYSEVSLDQFY